MACLEFPISHPDKLPPLGRTKEGGPRGPLRTHTPSFVQQTLPELLAWARSVTRTRDTKENRTDLALQPHGT